MTDFLILEHDQADDATACASSTIASVPNDANVLDLPLEGITRVELHFPVFTDGRAFSQAYLLRRRRGFAGDIRATGDVLIDQLLQMQRSGFSSARLAAGLKAEAAQRQLQRFGAFYQGDAREHLPHFARASQDASSDSPAQKARP